MSDFAEMAEAFEQARTAPDVTDRATGLEEAIRLATPVPQLDMFAEVAHG